MHWYTCAHTSVFGQSCGNGLLLRLLVVGDVLQVELVADILHGSQVVNAEVLISECVWVGVSECVCICA